MNAPRLPLSMIPSSAKANVRTVLSAEAWQAVAKEAKARAGHRCEACGSMDLPLESHEFFSFSAGGVQRLERIAALCAAEPASGRVGCHNVTHAGRTLRIGGGGLAEPIVERLMEVNGWGAAETIRYIQNEFALVRARGRQVWRLDVELLREFGLEPRELFPTRPLGTSWWRRLVGAA